MKETLIITDIFDRFNSIFAGYLRSPVVTVFTLYQGIFILLVTEQLQFLTEQGGKTGKNLMEREKSF